MELGYKFAVFDFSIWVLSIVLFIFSIFRRWIFCREYDGFESFIEKSGTVLLFWVFMVYVFFSKFRWDKFDLRFFLGKSRGIDGWRWLGKEGFYDGISLEIIFEKSLCKKERYNVVDKFIVLRLIGFMRSVLRIFWVFCDFRVGFLDIIFIIWLVL